MAQQSVVIIFYWIQHKNGIKPSEVEVDTSVLGSLLINPLEAARTFIEKGAQVEIRRFHESGNSSTVSIDQINLDDPEIYSYQLYVNLNDTEMTFKEFNQLLESWGGLTI